MKSLLKILPVILLLLFSCSENSELIFKPDFEVCVLLPAEGLGDRSFVDSIYEGVENAGLDFSFDVEYIIPDSLEAGLEWISRIPELKSRTGLPLLIIIAGSQFSDAVDSLNGGFGTHKVLFFEGTANEQPDLAQITYHTFATSYIAGYISAQQSESCRAVVISGFDAPFLMEFQEGFEQGVVDAGGSVNERAYISSGFSGFEMPDSAYAIAWNLLPANDLVFALASGSNSGIINAVRDYPEQRFVVGVDADQSWMGLKVVTGSVIKLFGLDIYAYIEQFSHGNFESGNFVKSIEDGRTSFFPNKVILGDVEIPESLINTAIQKENAYIENITAQ